MKKAKITVLALVIAVLSVCCFAFIGCGGDPGTTPTTQYNITWSVDSNLTVAVEGYTELPQKVDEGVELKFTVTPKTQGWTIASVSPTAIVKVQTDGSYKAVITKDIEIRIKAREEVEKLEITKPDSIKYYAGESFLKENNDGAYVMPEGWTVKAKFKTEREAELTPNDFVVKYQHDGAEAFTLGDVEFAIEYGGVKETITLADAVKGKLTINVGSGDWSTESLAALNQKFGEANITSKIDAEHDNAKIYEILYENVFEEDYTLPAPRNIIETDGVEFEFPVKLWQGIANGKIAKGTATGLSGSVVYDNRLVEFKSLSFTTKQVTETVTVTEGEGEGAHDVEKEVTSEVPYFVMTGNFAAVNKAQLYLKEGNEPPTELYGPEVVRAEDTDAFTLEFDLRVLVRWVNPKPKQEGDKNYKGTLKGAWNDIKFRISQGEKHLDQPIDLNDYADDFVDIGDTLEAEVDGVRYQFGYKVWTGSGSIGRDLKLVYNDCPDTVIKKVSLADHEFTVTTPAEEEGGEPTTEKKTLPAMVITGKNFTAETEEELKSLAEGYIQDMAVLDKWDTVAMTQDVTVDLASHMFTVYLSLENLQEGEVYFFHLGGGGDFANASLDVTSLNDSANTQYAYKVRLFTASDWKNGLVVVEYKNKRDAAAKPVTIAVEGDKAYMVITGTYTEWTEADFKAAIKLDFEDSTNGENKIILDAEKITLEFNADGTFTIKADVTDIAVGTYWVHLTGVLSGAGDIGNDAGFEPVACGAKTYGYVLKNFDWGAKNLFTVADATPEENPAE